MNIDSFRRNFPPGTPVPEDLVRLLEYQNQAGGWYSGRFELIVEPYPEVNAFDGDEEAAKQFVHFAAGPDGSTYAFWLYPGRTLDTAPIVFQGSEGTDWTVLADNLRDFLSLLALGETELGYSASGEYYSGPEYDLDALMAFRAWLKDEFGIVAPSDPRALVATAKGRHPDLDAWLDDWQTARG